MPRIRKEPNWYWAKKDKLKIINEVVIDGFSSMKISKKYDISNGMLCKWIKKYLEQGEESLENKKNR